MYVSVHAQFSLKRKCTERPQPGVSGESWTFAKERAMRLSDLAYMVLGRLLEFWIRTMRQMTAAEVNAEIKRLAEMIGKLEATEVQHGTDRESA